MKALLLEKSRLLFAVPDMSRIMEQHASQTLSAKDTLPKVGHTYTENETVSGGVAITHTTLDNSFPTATDVPGWYSPAKRTVDVLGAGVGLLLLFPIFLLIAVLILLDSRGPIMHRRSVLARQPHKDGDEPKTFDAFKFRTMIPDADQWLERHPEVFAEFQKEFKLKDDPRITRVGKWLRKTSLDELPQLINILMGQMSLVGPRMITPAELKHYDPYATKLMSVLPGLTGLWQVSGRSNISYTERVRIDMWYIDNRSLQLDLAILWRTVICVFMRKGAY